MKYSKFKYIVLGWIGCIVYGLIIGMIFSNIHNQLVGIPSGVISFMVLFLAYYHFLDYLLFRYYNKLIVNSEFIALSSMKTSIRTLQVPAQAYQIMINACIKIKEIKLLEKFDDLHMLILANDSSYTKWGYLTFIKIDYQANNNSIISFYKISIHYAKQIEEKMDVVNKLISEFKKYDLLDVEPFKN